MNLTIRSQMVKIHSVEVKKNEKSGEEFKIVLFTVADREKKLVKVNGKEEWITKGFHFCKAIGRVAEVVVNHLSKTDDKGKLISRKFTICGDMETYKSNHELDVNLEVKVEELCAALCLQTPNNLVGQKATLVKKEVVAMDKHIILVDRIEFDDFIEGDDKKAVPTNTEIKINLAGVTPNTLGVQTAVPPSNPTPVNPLDMPSDFNAGYGNLLS